MNPDSSEGSFLVDLIEDCIVTIARFYGYKLAMPPHDIAANVVKYFLLNKAGKLKNETR